MSDENSVKETCTKITIYVRTADVERAKRLAKRELHGSYQVILRNAITRGLRDKSEVR